MSAFFDILKDLFGAAVFLIVFVGTIRVFMKILEELGVFSFMEKLECKLFKKFAARRHSGK